MYYLCSFCLKKKVKKYETLPYIGTYKKLNLIIPVLKNKDIRFN